MSGNVWEWCSNVLVGTSYRHFRGGGWIDNADDCTVAKCDHYDDSDNRYYGIGFRLARSSGN